MIGEIQMMNREFACSYTRRMSARAPRVEPVELPADLLAAVGEGMLTRDIAEVVYRERLKSPAIANAELLFA